MTARQDVPVPPALLTPAQSQQARALVRWTEAELAAVAAACGDVVARAARRWAAGERTARALEALAVRAAPCFHAEDADVAARAATWTALDPLARWAMAGDPAARLREAFFGEAAVAPGARDGHRLADELAAECWGEQCAALQGLVREAVPEPARLDALAEPWQRWGGAVVVDLPWYGSTWRLLLAAPLVRGLLRRAGLRRPAGAELERPATAPVLRALDRAPVRLQVRLEPVEIDLGSLAALAVGDVLCLTHAVDEPARIVPPSAAADAPVLCHGWLGRRDDRAAVELVRRPAGPAAIR